MCVCVCVCVCARVCESEKEEQQSRGYRERMRRRERRVSVCEREGGRGERKGVAWNWLVKEALHPKRYIESPCGWALRFWLWNLGFRVLD